jgi:uncharacterized membrane protein YhaH (DUF805 family)
METSVRKLFTFQGRIGRRTFWLTFLSLALIAITLVVTVAAQDPRGLDGPGFWILWIPLYTCALWVGLATQVKRWHDLDLSGWFVLVGIIPIAGPLLALAACGFIKGTSGPNRFGDVPHQPMTMAVVDDQSAASTQITSRISASIVPTTRTSEAGLSPPAEEVLAEANQFLHYRAASRAKVDAQASLMDGLLARADAPRVRATLLRSADSSHEFPWLIVKSGTHRHISEMRSYGGFEETFRRLFGDQPTSIVWADRIAENCPGPGESVTPLGRERYARIVEDIREGKYVVERRLGESRTERT